MDAGQTDTDEARMFPPEVITFSLIILGIILVGIVQTVRYLRRAARDGPAVARFGNTIEWSSPEIEGLGGRNVIIHRLSNAPAHEIIGLDFQEDDDIYSSPIRPFRLSAEEAMQLAARFRDAIGDQ